MEMRWFVLQSAVRLRHTGCTKTDMLGRALTHLSQQNRTNEYVSFLHELS
jgi:hypothetical protein